MKTTRPARIAKNSPPEAPARSFLGRHPAFWPAGLIVLVGTAAYANSLRGVFVFDDLQSIVSNPALRSFPVLARILEDGRPVVFATLALNYAWSAARPWSYHLINITVHVLAALALFGIVRRTLELPAKRCGPRAALMALTIALLWMVHPLQTDSVTYVIQRAESLMGLFYLSALYCLIRGHASPHPRRWYAGAVASCLLGAGCKEVIVTLPLVAFAYDALFLTGSWRESLRRRWGMYLGLALCCVLAAFRFVFRAADAASTVGFGMKGVTPLQYALTQPGVILHYLRLSFWPWPLCLDYGWPFVRSAGDALPALLVVGALLAVSLLGVVRGRRWGFPGLAFFCILAPTSSIVPVQDAAFEHRMYLPLAAVIAGAVIAAAWCWNRAWPPASGRWSGRALAGAGVLAVAGCCVLTVRRNADYRDEVALWRQTVCCAPQNARAYGRLGAALVRRLPDDASAGGEEALRVLDQAIALKPDDADAWYNRGSVCARIGRTDEAVRDLDRAIVLRPGDADAYYNRGNVHLDAKRYAEAIRDYDQTIALEPDYADAWYNRANACASAGRPAEAVRDYSQAIELRPQDPDAYYNRAVVRSRLKQDSEALADFQMAGKLGRPAPKELLRSLRPSAELPR